MGTQRRLGATLVPPCLKRQSSRYQLQGHDAPRPHDAADAYAGGWQKKASEREPTSSMVTATEVERCAHGGGTAGNCRAPPERH